MRPGDTVNLTLSKGQELVDVPDVVGQPMNDALDTLRAAGFEVTYNFPEALLTFATCTETDPVGGTEAVKGSTITVVASLTL